MTEKSNKDGVISIRCPKGMLAQAGMYARYMHMNRSAFIVEAIRIFIAHARRRGGFIVPTPMPLKKRSRLKAQ